MSTQAPARPVPGRPGDRATRLGTRFLRDNAWTLALLVLFASLLWWQSMHIRHWGAFELETLFTSTLPVALLALAQAVVVIGGGIDLSVGAQAVLFNLRVRLSHGGRRPGVGPRDRSTDDAPRCPPRGPHRVDHHPERYPRHHRDPRHELRLDRARAARPAGPGRWRTHGVPADRHRGGKCRLAGALVVLAVPAALMWWPLRRTRGGLAVYALGSSPRAAFLAV